MRVGTHVRVEDASVAHYGEIGRVCKVHKGNVAQKSRAQVAFDDHDHHADEKFEMKQVALDASGNHLNDLASSIRTTHYNLDQLISIEKLGLAQQVEVTDPTLTFLCNAKGTAIHWEGSHVMVTFKNDSIADPPTRLNVRQVKIINTTLHVSDTVRIVSRTCDAFGLDGKVVRVDSGGGRLKVLISSKGAMHGKTVHYEKAHLHLIGARDTDTDTDRDRNGWEAAEGMHRPRETSAREYNFECYAFFTVVEKLRSAIGINRKDLQPIDHIVRNQEMWEWFTERIGHTEVVRNGRPEPLFFVMPEEYLDLKQRQKTEKSIMDVLMEAPRDNSDLKLQFFVDGAAAIVHNLMVIGRGP